MAAWTLGPLRFPLKVRKTSERKRVVGLLGGSHIRWTTKPQVVHLNKIQSSLATVAKLIACRYYLLPVTPSWN